VDFLRKLITDSKNGGQKALKKAVKYRLSKLTSRDGGELFQWVDGTPGEGGHGYFITIMRGEAVDLIRRYGSEIFIDR
jgi:hypothetical protein